MTTPNLFLNTPLRNYFLYASGELSGKPADSGTITFYRNSDHTTKQATYSDADMTIINPNPITLDENGSWPPIYMLDASYYIVGLDKFGQPLFDALENYNPANGGGGGGITGKTVQNLFPSYGFDSEVFADLYDHTALPAGENYVSGGIIFEWQSANSGLKNTYTYNALFDSGLVGNPKNELILRTASNSTGDTIKRFKIKIGSYNFFQGEELATSLFLRLVEGAPTSFTSTIYRTKNGVAQPALATKAISVTTSRSNAVYPFTVPVIADTGYINSDGLWWDLEFPLNIDLVLGITGTWMQESADGSVQISEQNYATDGWSQLTPQDALSDPTFTTDYSGFAMSYNPSGAKALVRAGFISVGLKGATIYNNTLNMATGPVITDPQSINNISCKRLIAALRTYGLTRSVDSFITVTKVSPALTIGYGIGAAPKSLWTSGSSNIVITKPVEEFQYKLSAALAEETVTFTFVDKFLPNTGRTIPTIDYATGGGGSNTVNSVRFLTNFNGGQNTDAPVAGLNSFFGTALPYTFDLDTNIVSSEAGGPVITGSIPPIQVVSPFVLTPITPGSGSTSCVVSVKFAPMIFRDSVFAANISASVGIPQRGTWLQSSLCNPIYSPYAVDINVGVTPLSVYAYLDGTSATVDLNYFGYNDLTSNASPQPYPPVRAITYSIEGVTPSNPVTGVMSTCLIDLKMNDQACDVARKTALAINTTANWLLTISALPANGESIEVSTANQDYIFIMWDTAQTRPANTNAARSPYWVRFTSATTVSQFVDALEQSFWLCGMGIPTPSYLGLPILDDNDYFITL